MNRPHRRDILVFIALVAVGVTARVVLQEIPNFAPVAALALFAGYLLTPWLLALCVPLAVMLISDRLVEAGSYDWRLMLCVYALLAFPVCLRGVTRRYLSLEQGSTARIGASLGGLFGCSLACSLLFFVGTNIAVWLTSSWYPPTTAGLWQCLMSAVPFFRYTIAGDAVFSGIFFGGYAAIRVAAIRQLNHRTVMIRP